MKFIHKYIIPYRNMLSKINMPQGAKIISVAMQHKADIFLWAIVDPSKAQVVRRIVVIGTEFHIPGFIPTPGQFLGTAIDHEYEYNEVYHIFDLGEA